MSMLDLAWPWRWSTNYLIIIIILWILNVTYVNVIYGAEQAAGSSKFAVIQVLLILQITVYLVSYNKQRTCAFTDMLGVS